MKGTEDKPYVQPFRDVNGRWRFRIRARNHRILASSEAYSAWRKCWDAVVMIAVPGDLPVDFRHVVASGELAKMSLKDLEGHS
ncbi:MAG TPA: DUF1508 domain-containing protein [Phycisphaerae bacterium]|nr:DUF1508 domain-containing protein [Phycisphaerae bacterium]